MNEDENIVEKLMEKADRMLDRLTEALTDEDDDALAPPLSPLPPTEEPLGGSADDLPF